MPEAKIIIMRAREFKREKNVNRVCMQVQWNPDANFIVYLHSFASFGIFIAIKS